MIARRKVDIKATLRTYRRAGSRAAEQRLNPDTQPIPEQQAIDTVVQDLLTAREYPGSGSAQRLHAKHAANLDEGMHVGGGVSRSSIRGETARRRPGS